MESIANSVCVYSHWINWNSRTIREIRSISSRPLTKNERNENDHKEWREYGDVIQSDQYGNLLQPIHIFACNKIDSIFQFAIDLLIRKPPLNDRLSTSHNESIFIGLFFRFIYVAAPHIAM